ncbi:spore germination protein [Bacillus manliponensis]|uniref:spore germination protein n=1 Tax=Bacillus manliponensis TaxID=574376 RepID=UPI0035180978
MSSFIRKIKIVNNNGAVHFGDYNTLNPVYATKVYNGSGSLNSAVFLNGERVPFERPRASVFISPLGSSTITLGA